ncbi:CBASS oligonucleotide cyclase [Herminiimonas fonticola]|uniref:Nucleotidyltransferase-like protein n=1 Tax=Herminiimonas fonticola TaxID=303380 RepID=A0A4R6GID4_9BURK|nr:CBASS oligonucleotide cyclase [Herminiimonas fonticola]RBA25662.1 Nucleotidyltransferase domain [Herminiimonas fonticola]TDN94771.1 nucleotidyltransferase-like protein [Herminiimonas fonticola]
MSRAHIDHRDLIRFAEDKVNLSKNDATDYRAQVRRLREKLETHISENPDFTLRKMQLSGSLAKGTALRTLNDIDVAMYVSGPDAPGKISDLLDYIVKRLQTAFPNFSDDQVKKQTYSVTVSFRGSGLDVDVVPVLYYDEPDWRGNLVSQEDGSFLETSIPLHLEFIKKRKEKHPQHFAQVVRLVKWWVRKLKLEDENFRFKSFMVELMLAKLSDDGVDFSDYPNALQEFFTFLAAGGLEKRIVFSDHYKPSDVPACNDVVQIFDPINPLNNVAKLYQQAQVDAISDAANDAGDAIDAALNAPTKELTVKYWQKVFGSSFQG